MTSIPQPNAGNKVYSMPRGKLLGGSSGINYLMYVRGSKADYDANWESMDGCAGWGWSGMAPYFRKHHTIDRTESSAKKPLFMPATESEEYHSKDGPIHTSFNDWYMPLEEDFANAAYELTGGHRITTAYQGDHHGFYSSLGAVNRSDDYGKRSYAATGYLRPNLGRPNLKVLTEAQATKILLDGTVAKGVEFVHKGKKYSVNAKREVILSTGVIQSPQLLELSGIGDPEVLKAAGVDVIVENKGVGSNFQDHVLGGVLYDLKPGVESMDALHNEEFLKAQQVIYDKTGNGMFGNPGMAMGFVSYAQIVSPKELEDTIKEIKTKSLAKSAFEKAQEQVSKLYVVESAL